MAIKKIRLTPKQVKAYEKMSGFKTNGNVVLEITDDKVWSEYERLLLPNDSKSING